MLTLSIDTNDDIIIIPHGIFQYTQIRFRVMNKNEHALAFMFNKNKLYGVVVGKQDFLINTFWIKIIFHDAYLPTLKQKNNLHLH